MIKRILFLLPCFVFGMEEECFVRMRWIVNKLSYNICLTEQEKFEYKTSYYTYLISDELSDFCLGLKKNFIEKFYEEKINNIKNDFNNYRTYYDFSIFSKKVDEILNSENDKKLNQILLIQDSEQKFNKIKERIDKDMKLSGAEEEIKKRKFHEYDYSENKESIEEIFLKHLEINESHHNELKKYMPLVCGKIFAIKTAMKEIKKNKSIFEFINITDELDTEDNIINKILELNNIFKRFINDVYDFRRNIKNYLDKVIVNIEKNLYKEEYDLILKLNKHPKWRIYFNGLKLDIVKTCNNSISEDDEIGDHITLLQNPKLKGEQILFPTSFIDAKIATKEDHEFFYKYDGEIYNCYKNYLKNRIETLKLSFKFETLNVKKYDKVIVLETKDIKTLSRLVHETNPNRLPSEKQCFAHITFSDIPHNKIYEDLFVKILENALLETVNQWKEREKLEIKFSEKNICFN